MSPRVKDCNLGCLCLLKLLQNTAQPQRQQSQGKGVGQFHEDSSFDSQPGLFG